MINLFQIFIFYFKHLVVSPFILKKINQSLDLTTRKIAESIQFVKNKQTWTHNEKVLIEQIKHIRNESLASTNKLSIVDYGAGSVKLNNKNNKVVSMHDLCKVSSTPHEWGLILFKMIRTFKPKYCLELGTCIGISSIYQLAALQLNKSGKLATIEGAEPLIHIAESNFKKMNFNNYEIYKGQFSVVLPNLLNKNNLIDFVFIDGHHNEQATLDYFNMIYPFLNNNAILIFDDINWSLGMRKAWRILKKDERISFTIDLFKWGICVKN
jgi:predicted O-methyltransferase YrrM